MKKLLISLIDLYKKHISPLIVSRNMHCRFYPTCSDYTRQAIEKYGAFRGSIKGIIRIFKCNPFSKGGYDPLK